MMPSGGRRGRSGRRKELISGANERLSRRSRVRWARAPTGRWVLVGREGRGVSQLRGITLWSSRVQSGWWKWGVWNFRREGKDLDRRPIAGYIWGGEHTSQRAAMCLLWDSRTERGGLRHSDREGCGQETVWNPPLYLSLIDFHPGEHAFERTNWSAP